MEDLYSLLNITKDNQWYKLITTGLTPSERVGHACIFIPKEITKNDDELHLIGGANLKSTLNDHFVLTLRDLNWKSFDSTGFDGRYEHCGCLSSNSIYVFGGADINGNRNDIQIYDLKTEKWRTLEADANFPPPRTQHSAGISDDSIIIMGGGAKNSSPVSDLKVHHFHPDTKMWQSYEPLGHSPLPRQGHVSVVVGRKLFLHGGMAGEKFYDDLFVLNLQSKKWEELDPKGDIPSPRAAHGAVLVGDCSVYIFGGLGPLGALGDFYRLNVDALEWTKISVPAPSPRLDFGMCVVKFKHVPGENGEDTSLDKSTSCKEKTLRTLIFLHGGIKSVGEVFDDCYIFVCD